MALQVGCSSGSWDNRATSKERVNFSNRHCTSGLLFLGSSCEGLDLITVARIAGVGKQKDEKGGGFAMTDSNRHFSESSNFRLVFIVRGRRGRAPRGWCRRVEFFTCGRGFKRVNGERRGGGTKQACIMKVHTRAICDTDEFSSHHIQEGMQVLGEARGRFRKCHFQHGL